MLKKEFNDEFAIEDAIFVRTERCCDEGDIRHWVFHIGEYN